MEHYAADTNTCCIGTFTVDVPYSICTGSLDNNAEILIGRVFASAANLVNRSLISPSPLFSSSSSSRFFLGSNCNVKHCTTLESKSLPEGECEHRVQFSAVPACSMALQSSESSYVMDICSWVEVILNMPKQERQCVKLEWTRQMQDYVSRFVDRALTRVYPVLDPLQYIHANSPLFKVVDNSSNVLCARFVIRPDSKWKQLYQAVRTLTCKNTDAFTVWQKMSKYLSSNALNAWRLHTVEGEMLVSKEYSSIEPHRKDYGEEKQTCISAERISDYANVNNNKENTISVNGDNNLCDVDAMKLNSNGDDDDLWRRARAANTKNNLFKECGNNELKSSNISGNFGVDVVQNTFTDKVKLALDTAKYTWKVARLMTERMINSHSWALERGEEQNGHKRPRVTTHSIRYSNIVEATMATRKELGRQRNRFNVSNSTHKCQKPESELNGYHHNNEVNSICDDLASEKYAHSCRLTHIDGCGIEFNATVVGYTRRYTYFGIPVASLQTLQGEEEQYCVTTTTTTTNNKCSTAMNSAVFDDTNLMEKACNECVTHYNISNSTFHVVARTPHPSWYGLYHDNQHDKIHVDDNSNNNYVVCSSRTLQNHQYGNISDHNIYSDGDQQTRVNKEKTMPVHLVNTKVPNYRLRNLRNALLFDEADSFVHVNAKTQYTCTLRAHRVSCEYMYANVVNSESESSAIAIWFDDVYTLSSQPIELCVDDYKEVLSLIVRSCARYIASLSHFDKCVRAKNENKSSNNTTVNETDASASKEKEKYNSKNNNGSKCCNTNVCNAYNDIYVQAAIRAKRMYDMMNDSVNVRFKKVKTSYRKREQASFIPVINTCRDIAPLREGCCVEFKHHLHLQSMNTNYNNNDNNNSNQSVFDVNTNNNGQKRAIMDAERIRNTMSAMASTHGGVILIGVADDGTVYGHVTGGEATQSDYGVSRGAYHNDLRRELRLTGFCPAMVKDSITLRQVRVLSLPFTTSNITTTSTLSSRELAAMAQGKEHASAINVTSSCKMPPNWWKIKESPVKENARETKEQNANSSTTLPLSSLSSKVVTILYVNKGEAPFYRNSRRSLPYWRTCASTTTIPVSAMISRLFAALY